MSSFLLFLFFFYFKIYFFLAALGSSLLRRLSPAAESRSYFLFAVGRLLTAVISLAAER